MAGILLATAANHTLAATVGVWASRLLPPVALAWALALSFLAFGVWTLIPDRAPEATAAGRWGPLLTTTVVFFLAEMGDKTQLATVALGARFEAAAAVTIGTTLGMLVGDGLVVFGGTRLSRVISPARLRRLAAALFLVLGLMALVGAVSR